MAPAKRITKRNAQPAATHRRAPAVMQVEQRIRWVPRVGRTVECGWPVPLLPWKPELKSCNA
jgi:hypothetical protein